MIENLIHRRKSELDLTNNKISAVMTSAIGEKVSPESVGHYFTGEAGIPLEKLEAFLYAIGLKVVRQEDVHVSSDKYQALAVLAAEALRRDTGKTRRG